MSLATRQTIGATEITIGRDTTDPSKFNTSDVMIFMKNLEVNGYDFVCVLRSSLTVVDNVSRTVNPVTDMYAAFPFFLNLNASYCGYMLEPVLAFASSPQWSLSYPPPDIGE